MSWLYEHRYSTDGLRPLIEIAHSSTRHLYMSPQERDDIEQEVLISLLATIEKHGEKPKSYLELVARGAVCRYLRKKHHEAEIYQHILENGKGEIVQGTWEPLQDDSDFDARLDAIITLASLPKRLIEIGYKRLNGEKLNNTERRYESRQRQRLRTKLKMNGYHLSDQEKKQILQMHNKGMSTLKIARTLGREFHTVERVLGDKRRSRQEYLEQMRMAAKERDERIRYAYIVEGKSINQIVRELHVAKETVSRAIKIQRYPERRR
jgi:DNA-directed RNA polymerase specialized sigma24 family protein